MQSQAWVWDLLVLNPQPRLSFYRLIKVMPKLMKFKGQKSQDKIRHILIFDEEQNVHFTFCEKRPILFTKSLWFHVSVNSMLPFGARADNLYIGRTPFGGRPVINISPGTLQGSAQARKGSRPAPLDTVGYGSRYIYWLKSAKEIARCPVVCRPVPGRAPYATRRGFHGLFTGYRFE